MSETLAVREAQARPNRAFSLDWLPVMPRIAWRNLGRRRYRTLISIGSFAFAVLLVGAGISVQVGAYSSMIKRGTELMSGHGQIQHPDWLDDAKLEYLIDDASALAALALSHPGVTGVSVRAQASGLVANSGAPDKAGKAGLIMGIEPSSEPQVSAIPDRLIAGRYIESGDEAMIGVALARNLNLEIGDEITVIGAAESGGIAAFVCEVVGIFDAGFPALNRTLVQVPIALVSEAFDLQDRASNVVMRVQDPMTSREVLSGLAFRIEQAGRMEGIAVRDWREVNSELYSSILLDAIGSVFMYAFIVLMVGFTILGSVLMVMFERRAEFGVLMALGMRVGMLRRLISWEVLWLWLCGMLLGLAVVAAVVGWYGEVGIPMPTDEAMQDILDSVHMDARMYPEFSSLAFVWVPCLLLALAQLAAVLATRKLGRQLPAEVLRSV